MKYKDMKYAIHHHLITLLEDGHQLCYAPDDDGVWRHVQHEIVLVADLSEKNDWL